MLWGYPWGRPGTPLEKEHGQDEWQRAFLQDLGTLLSQREFDGINPADPIQMAVASGHGIEKSRLIAWLHWWIMSTRPNSKGRVTVNTYTQLETTTWADIQRWHRLLKCGDAFEVTGSRCCAKQNPEAWLSIPITCAEENSEAFAGQHNKNSTSFFLFDESSLIPDKIWKVAGAGLTDGEPMWFAFGNPTSNTGAFYEATFGNQAHRWHAWPRYVNCTTPESALKSCGSEQGPRVLVARINPCRVHCDHHNLPPAGVARVGSFHSRV